MYIHVSRVGSMSRVSVKWWFVKVAITFVYRQTHNKLCGGQTRVKKAVSRIAHASLVHPGEAPIVPEAQCCAGCEESIRTERSQTGSSPYCTEGKFLLCHRYVRPPGFLSLKPPLLQASRQLARPSLTTTQNQAGYYVLSEYHIFLWLLSLYTCPLPLFGDTEKFYVEFFTLFFTLI